MEVSVRSRSLLFHGGQRSRYARAPHNRLEHRQRLPNQMTRTYLQDQTQAL